MLVAGFIQLHLSLKETRPFADGSGSTLDVLPTVLMVFSVLAALAVLLLRNRPLAFREICAVVFAGVPRGQRTVHQLSLDVDTVSVVVSIEGCIVRIGVIRFAARGRRLSRRRGHSPVDDRVSPPICPVPRGLA